MAANPATDSSRPPVSRSPEFEGNLVAMNEELMLRFMRQHELTEAALSSNFQLQKEISARQKAEAELRESEERYRMLFDLGPVAIYYCDAAGLIQKFNRCAAKLWGRKPTLGETTQRFCGSVRLFRTDGTLMPHKRCPMADVLAGKRSEVRNREVIIERPDGTRITVVVDIRPLKVNGKITGAINCFYDITEQKQAEAARLRLAVLAATNRKLEREAAHRQAVEKALKKSERQQRRLWEESQRIHDQLRGLSRQLLLAQEEERKRISRELHDVIAQTLTGINLRLAAVKGDATMSVRERERIIARTQQLVAQSVSVVHQFARELRPTMLDDIGLIPALHTFARSFKQETGIHVSVSTFAGVERLEADKRIVFYRVAQEALTNVARHAHATRVEVNIQERHGAVCMKITDNGNGFPVSSGQPRRENNRLGLLGMKERLEMVGGKFSIESIPGKGASVIAQFPAEKIRRRRHPPTQKASP